MKNQAEGALQDKDPPKLEQGAQLEGGQKPVRKALEGPPKEGANFALPRPPPEQAVPAAAVPPQPVAGVRGDNLVAVDGQKQPGRQPNPLEQDTLKMVKRSDGEEEGGEKEGQQEGARREGQEEGGGRRGAEVGGGKEEAPAAGIPVQSEEGFDGGLQKENVDVGVAAAPKSKEVPAREPEKREAGGQGEGDHGGPAVAQNGEEVRKVRELKAVSMGTRKRNASTGASNK